MELTQRGKTLLKGHALFGEGSRAFTAEGRLVGSWSYNAERGGCQCGAVAPAGLSVSATRKWHREHKDALRGES